MQIEGVKPGHIQSHIGEKSPVNGDFNFAQALEQTRQELFPSIASIEQATQKIVTRVKPEYADLLKTQIYVNEYAMRVELLSKAGEGLSGTIKRLQQG